MDVWNNLTDSFNKDMAIDEMRRKYENTYLVLKQPDGKELVACYKGFNDGFHMFRDELETPLRLRHETSYEVICKFPERCLFNHNGLALEFIRSPKRQYKRGICKDNVFIYSPVRSVWSVDSYNWTMKTIVDALYPTYPVTCEEAIKQLEGRSCASIALNPKFMLSLSFTSQKKEFYLFYSNVPIGSFKDGVFTIAHRLFKQEVIDDINLFKPYRVEFTDASSAKSN
jgi:hypothetical protein